MDPQEEEHPPLRFAGAQEDTPPPTGHEDEQSFREYINSLSAADRIQAFRTAATSPRASPELKASLRRLELAAARGF